MSSLMRKINILFVVPISLLVHFYSTAQTWDSLLSGANDYVYALKEFDGGLAVGGEFTQMNGASHICLAYWVSDWSGYYWSYKLGGTFNSSATVSNISGADMKALESFDNRLHVGGNFYHPYYFGNVNIGYMEYDSFNDDYDFDIYYSSPNSDVLALKNFGDKLFIGGWFTGFVGNDYIAYIDSGDYPSPFPKKPGDGLDGSVYCFAVYNNELYAGGAFSNSGTTAVSNIAKWNGSAWSAVGTGVNSTVYSMEVYNNELVVGGIFTDAGGVAVNNIAKWNNNTSSWSTLGDGLTKSFSASVRACKVYGSKLYAGGAFDMSDTISLSNLAMWDGIKWSSAGTGTNGTVHCLEAFENRLYIGGEFTMANDMAANYIVAYDDGSQTGLNNMKGKQLAPNLFPNPVSGKININFISYNKAYSVTVSNINGKTVYHSQKVIGKTEIDLSNLAKGLYIVKIIAGDEVIVEKISLQ